MSGFIENVHITLFQGFNVHPNPHCPATREFKSAYTALRVMYYSTPCNPNLTKSCEPFITISLLLYQMFGRVTLCWSTSPDLHSSKLPCHVHGEKPSPITLVLIWQKKISGSLWNKPEMGNNLPRECFPKNYYIGLFMFRVNRYLSSPYS